jgi:hypothetical protein
VSTIPSTGNKRWVSLYIYFDRKTLDPQIDGSGDTIYADQPESFVFEVDRGTEAVTPTDKANLKSGKILLADFEIDEDSAVVTTDLSRRQGWIRFVDSDATPTTRLASGYPIRGLQIDGSTQDALRDAIMQLLGYYNDHVNGDGDEHSGINVNMPAVSGTPHSLTADVLTTQIEDIVDQMNDPSGDYTSLAGTITYPRGMIITGGGSSEDAITAVGGAPNGDGVFATADGTGYGIRAYGSSDGVDSIAIYAVGGNDDGIGIVGQGDGSGDGIRGYGGASSGVGIHGQGGVTNGIGVHGEGDGSGDGVKGSGSSDGDDAVGVRGVGGTDNGIGVRGEGDGTGEGVYGLGGGSSGTGVYGLGGASNGDGVKGDGDGTGAGVVGAGTGASPSPDDYCGVYGIGASGQNAHGGHFQGVGNKAGIYAVGGATAGYGYGVHALGGSGGGYGVYCQGTTSYHGIYAIGGPTASAGACGVAGVAGGYGLLGVGYLSTASPTAGTGTYGIGASAGGLGGEFVGVGAAAGIDASAASNSNAIEATATGSGKGIYATSADNYAGHFISSDSSGVYATSNETTNAVKTIYGETSSSSASSAGVSGSAGSGRGVEGSGTVGVYGSSTSGIGTQGSSSGSGTGVYGNSTSGYGIIAQGHSSGGSSGLAAFRIVPQDATPNTAAAGDMCVVGTTLYICTNPSGPVWENLN